MYVHANNFDIGIHSFTQKFFANFPSKNLHMYVIFQDRKKKENHVMRMEK